MFSWAADQSESDKFEIKKIFPNSSVSHDVSSSFVLMTDEKSKNLMCENWSDEISSDEFVVTFDDISSGYIACQGNFRKENT